MSAVAASEKLHFIDNSASQARDLEDIEAGKALKSDASWAIDFHIEGPKGLGVTAGNLGLPPYQVGLGFTDGADPAKARRLANLLIASLSQRWHVDRVPTDQGIMPSRACAT
jgi:hypothetical protein